MNLEESTQRHGLTEIPGGSQIPELLTPQEGDDEDNFRFFINHTRTLGLGLNDTKEEIRIVFAELGVADTGWIPISDALRATGIE